MITKKVRVEPDPEPINPREEFDHVGKMACWHERYNLGDVQPKEPPDEFLESLPEDSLILPLYLLDHSSLALSVEPFSDPWDSCIVGYIYTTPEIIDEAFDGDRELAKRCLKAEVAEYNTYLSGEVYGVVVETYDDDKLIDTESCWGYYGYEYAKEEAAFQESNNSPG